ncbi:MAG: hypothetical protein P8R42_07360 [Candidatus Binatia bacterium]|nr:hypothetical protein [Candidatus Binatia bacterium]
MSAAALLCVAVLAAEAAKLPPARKLFVVDTGTGHRLGEAVSIDGEIAVIFAPGDDRGDVRGAAYVYERHGDQ